MEFFISDILALYIDAERDTLHKESLFGGKGGVPWPFFKVVLLGSTLGKCFWSLVCSKNCSSEKIYNVKNYITLLRSTLYFLWSFSSTKIKRKLLLWPFERTI